MKRINFMLNERDSYVVDGYIKLSGYKLNKICYKLIVQYCEKMLARRLKKENRVKSDLEENIKKGQEVFNTLLSEVEAIKPKRKYRKKSLAKLD